MSANAKENVLTNHKHLLVYDEYASSTEEFEYVQNNFCGKLINVSEFDLTRCKGSSVYLCGDIQAMTDCIDFEDIRSVNVIRELSTNYDSIDQDHQLITLGEIPIDVFGVGILFKKLFSSAKNYYSDITTEHEFQTLGISGKPGKAYRKGIYLTHVDQDNGSEETRFNLLRCSTNLGGPTDNFRDTDHEIIDRVNEICRFSFRDDAELNHVLAQTYHNAVITNGETTKERKAKISEHSDKTKDMPKTAVMAFCSFYEGFVDNEFDPDLKIKRSTEDPYDYRYNETSALTRLRFRLKDEVTDDRYEKKFDITLYPNSVFVMPLSTNRLYTHEIIPSILPVDRIPTRMGYVIRCSNTDAVHKEGQTYIIKNGECLPLEEPTKDGLAELKDLYYKENSTIEMVDYEDKFFFSMNRGDYEQPIV
jgi:hypothetical protein